MVRNSAMRWLNPKVSNRGDVGGDEGRGSEQGQILLSSAPGRKTSEYHLWKAW